MKETKRIGKRDVILLVVVLLILLAVLFAFRLRHTDSGSSAVITIDGEEYGTYDLGREQEIPIEVDGTVTNVLQIHDGHADMIEANCPDQLCVHQKAISLRGETIVCLPNKIVVSVESEEESEIDTIAQ